MKKAILFFLIITVLIASCGTNFSGTYSDSMHASTFTFKPNGKVDVTGMTGMQTESTYEKDGNQIKIKGVNGSSLVFTIQNDGSLTNGMLTLQKN